MQLQKESSYRGAEKNFAEAKELLRMNSNRTSNQLSILIKKRKERLANAQSFGSLSRFSQPNDSDSSFKNAYEEYRNKSKRTDSPLTKFEKNKFTLLPSRNEISDAINKSHIVNHKHELDQLGVRSDKINKHNLVSIKSTIHNHPPQFSSHKNSRDKRSVLETTNSLSMIETHEQLVKQTGLAPTS